MHVGRRIVGAERHAIVIAGFCELGDDVFAVGSVGDLVVRIGGIEHTKAVVVLGCKHHVLLPCGSRQIDKRLRIKLHRIEGFGQGTIFGLGNAARLGDHDRPGSFHAGLRIRTPVDEHAELGIAIPGCPVAGNGVSPPWAGEETGDRNQPEQA